MAKHYPGLRKFVGAETASASRRVCGSAENVGGFTLIELMIVVTIIGVLTMIAAPNFGPLLSKNKISSQVNTFLADLNLARSEAIKRSAQVVICKTATPTAAAPTCDATLAAPWSTGWLIFFDANADQSYISADNDVLIKISGALDSKLQLSAASGNARNWLAFTRTGGSSEAAIFTLCNATESVERRVVTINSIGRAILTKTTKGCA